MKIIEFISGMTKVFEQAQDERDLTTGLLEMHKSFYANMNVEIFDFKIYTYDKVSKKLRFFAKDWQLIDDPEDKKIPVSQYNFLKKKPQKSPKFVINQKEFTYSKNLDEMAKAIRPNTHNKAYFPLNTRDETIGIIEVDFNSKDKVEITKTFFELIQFGLAQITLAVVNMQTKDKMQVTINFYKTIKNIAKIIETQYELNYILPILGEMIDNFIYGHLIYIFLKVPKKKEYKLVWPANCSSGKVMKNLQKLTPHSGTLIEEDGKMGIFPLYCENKVIGAIVSYNRFERLTKPEIEYLEQLAVQSSETVDRANSYSRILQHATLDALTGLNNRHQFAHRLKQEVATAKRQNLPLCCMMIDIDYFKSVNDTYGHAVGDAVLKEVSKIIRKEIREYDIASRYGGEEFSIILPHTTIDEAYLVANRLRKEVEKKKISIEEYKVHKKNISITLSIGINAFDKHKPSELLYQDADKALYEAKKRGRNRVVIFEEK